MTECEREAYVSSLIPLLRRIARRVNRMVRGSDLGDLIGDGSIGLVRAVDGFDPSRATNLEAYAGKLILGTMLNGLRRMDPVSERVRHTIRRAERDRYRLAVMRGSMPPRSEMLHRHPGVERAMCSAYRSAPLSLDAPLPIGERVSYDAACDPASIVAESDERRYLRALVDELPERQRYVVLVHYYGSASLRQAGARYNISSQRASQLHTSAIARLRKRMHAAPHRT